MIHLVLAHAVQYAALVAAALLLSRAVYGAATAGQEKRRRKHPRAGCESALDAEIAERLHLEHAEELVGVRGRTLYRQTWLPAGGVPPRAVVLFVHGINSHSGFVAPHVETVCVRHGFALVGVDQHAYGRSDGTHSFLSSTLELAADVDAHARQLAALPQYRGLPIFLLGSSLGGHVVLRALAELDVCPAVRGAVCLAPAVEIAPGRMPHPAVVAAARALAWLWPSMPLLPGKPPGSGAYDSLEEELAEREHPLVYRGWMRVQTGLAIEAGIAALAAALPRVTTPLLILHGTNDVICDISGSRRAIDAVRSEDKKLLVYEGGRHVLLRGPHPAVADACEWMAARVRR